MLIDKIGIPSIFNLILLIVSGVLGPEGVIFDKSFQNSKELTMTALLWLRSDLL